MRNFRAAVVPLLAVLALIAGCRVDVVTAGSVPSSVPSPVTSSPGPSARAGGGGAAHVPAGTLSPDAAGAALAALHVAAKGGLGGYDRGCGHGQGCVFGPAWADVDHNGCDQRNDVLHRDLTGVQVRAGTHGCVVVGGTLADPYTGTVVPFVKADAAEIPIDHVVPLAAAWVQGAAAWPLARRTQLANDLGNLMATDREQNSAKGDSTADEWVPPNRAYGCSYATVVITVKQRYALSVTSAEAAALRSLLRSC
ncbi:MAG: HNH endonuclease family protein [Blastococcus sp.]